MDNLRKKELFHQRGGDVPKKENKYRLTWLGGIVKRGGGESLGTQVPGTWKLM